MAWCHQATSQYLSQCWLGRQRSESRIDHWIVWELTPINRLQFSKIDLFTDCSPAQPIIQTAPVTAHAHADHPGGKSIVGRYSTIPWLKLMFFCIKIHWIYHKMAWIMWHRGGKPVWCQQVSQWGIVRTRLCEVFLTVGITSPTQLSTHFHQRLIDHKNLAKSEP